jgi:hypothetical protein
VLLTLLASSLLSLFHNVNLVCIEVTLQCMNLNRSCYSYINVILIYLMSASLINITLTSNRLNLNKYCEMHTVLSFYEWEQLRLPLFFAVNA